MTLPQKENLTLKERLINRISEGACPIRADQICEVVRDWLEYKNRAHKDNNDWNYCGDDRHDSYHNGVEDTYDGLIEEVSQ
jgi:hypothetical protein